MFEADLKSNLYRIWDRMSSGVLVPAGCQAGRDCEKKKRNPNPRGADSWWRLPKSLGFAESLIHKPYLCLIHIAMSNLLIDLSDKMGVLLARLAKPHHTNDAQIRIVMTLFCQPNYEAYPTEICGLISQSAAQVSKLGDQLLERG
jgi:hypothetical protein